MYKRLKQTHGRFVVIKGKIVETKICIVSVYVPNRDKCLQNFFERMQKDLLDCGVTNEESIVIGGDFNCPLDPLIDKRWHSDPTCKCYWSNWRNSNKF